MHTSEKSRVEDRFGMLPMGTAPKRRDVAGRSAAAAAAAPSSGRRQRAAVVRFEPVGAVLRWIVPPGAYQPAFFRTAGEVS